jgi:predicted nucleic acid-binding protein
LSVGNDRGFLIFGSEIDCLIATWCIEHGVPLLFSDRDYEPFVEHLGLRAA